MTTSKAIPAQLIPAFTNLLLSGADDDFLIGHADSEWTGLGPMLEEDIAFSSIAQDEIAHAREIYGVVGGLLGRPADAVAFGRTPAEYRCAALTYRADDFDWSRLVARQFYHDHYDAIRLTRWAASSHVPLAEVARRIAAEESFHVHHVNDWMRRLGHAGDEPHRRIQSALDAFWPDALGLFEEVDDAEGPVAAGLYPAPALPMFEQFRMTIDAVLSAASLRLPAGGPDVAKLSHGGRRGWHGPRLTEVLEELGEVFRLEPNATW